MPEIDTIFSSWLQFAVACVVMAIGEMVYVMFGFGVGLIVVGFLAMLLPDLLDAVVLLLLVNAPGEIYVVVSSWRKIEWRGLALLAPGVALGIPLGTYALRIGEPTFVLTLLGGFLVAVGLTFVVVPEGRRVRWPAWATLPTGLLSGVLSGMFGTGGPPLILYYKLGGVEKAVFRGNLMALFLLVTLVRVPSYAVGGLITPTRIWSSAALLLPALFGMWLGNRIHYEMEERTFQKLVSVLLVLLGAVLLLRG